MRQMLRSIALTATLLLVGIGTVTHGQGTCLLPGCLDASFGDNGMVSTPLLTGGVKTLAVQTINGQDLILATNSAGNWTIARFLPSGSLDTSFGTGGIVTRTYRKGYAWADEVAVQPDGKIVVLGRLPIGPVVSGTPSSTLVVTRYQADGKSFDQTFGAGGTVIINPPPGALPFRAGDHRLALQSDGKILVAAAADADRDPYTAPFADLHVARLDSAGRFDNAFGPNPQDAFASFPNAGKPTSMVIQRVRVSENVFEERIVLSTATQVSYGSDVLPYHVTSVRRLTASGSPDLTFADAGVAQMAIPSADTTIFRSIAVDSRNRIVAAGGFYPDSSVSSPRMLMARYLENGSLDTSFGNLGTLRQDWLDAVLPGYGDPAGWPHPRDRLPRARHLALPGERVVGF